MKKKSNFDFENKLISHISSNVLHKPKIIIIQN